MTPRYLILTAVILALSIAPAQQASARGFGGFHGGGGGFHASSFSGGGFHSGGYGGFSGYHASSYGGYHASGAGAYGGYHTSDAYRGGGSAYGGDRFGGEYGSEFGGMSRSSYATPSRSGLSSFLGLPSDEGFHSLSAGGASSLGSEVNVQRGAVEGPRGGYAAGATAEGPRGNTVARGAAVGPNGGVATGRGVEGKYGGAAVQGAAVGPDGRVAGGSAARGAYGGAAARGFVAGPRGVAAGFARVSPSGRYATAAAVRGNFVGYGLYGRGWYANHPGAWFAAGWAGSAIWNAATWGSLGNWFGYDNAAPIYYDYGNNIVDQDNNVYVNGQDTGTSAQYYGQASSLAEAGTDVKATADEQWLPLGVFALTPADQKQSNIVIQLAVNKQGILRGNYTDTLTDQPAPIHGAIDEKSQRASWTVGDNKSTVMETGLYNLTKDEAPVLVMFGKERTEQWLLVRLTNDEAAKTTGQ